MSMHSELIQGLEALTAWHGVKVFTGRARQQTVLPYALVNPIRTPQPTATTGSLTSVFSAFEIMVLSGLQLDAAEKGDAAYHWIRDLTGKVIVTGSRVVEAANVEESSDSQLIPPGDGSEDLIYQSSFTVTLIHKAA